MPGRQFVSSSTYRYGFNGQEKVDEIAGAGNHNTAEFGELDTRLGRRWNEDPKPNPSVSNYAVFGNNPIYNFDTKLDTPTVGNRVAGGAKVIFGAIEAVAGGVEGIATAATGVGAVVGWGVLVHGADNMSTGINQMVTGEETQTLTEKTLSKTLQYAGVSKPNADGYAATGNLLLSIAGSGNLVAQADNLAVKISKPALIASQTTKTGGSLIAKGLGSTGRTTAANLTEQLAMKEIVANPTLGKSVMTGMKDSRWLGWNKMQYTHTALDGTKTTIHYVGQFKNGVLNAVDDFKFK